METELWNLAVKGNNMTAYTRRFYQLVLLCTRMVPNEEDKVEIFIGGLLDNIQGNIIAAEHTKLQDAIRIANNLMDQKLRGYARSAENKRRLENPRDTRGKQPVFKRQNVKGQNMARAYTTGNNEKKGYVGSLPYCKKCKLHHAGPCTMRCGNLGRSGDNFRKDCLKLRNLNRGNKTRNKNGNKTKNQTRGNEATTRAYAIRGGGENPDSNVVTGHYYSHRTWPKENVSEQIIVLIEAVTLGIIGYSFDIDIMPVELGRFNVIIRMDWLAKYHALIVCDEKVICIPYGDEVLIIHGGMIVTGVIYKTGHQSMSKTIILTERCHVLSSQVTSKKLRTQVIKRREVLVIEENRLEDVPIVREFLEVFPEDLPGLPPA
ncbi:hypothetical protein Tco_0572528 [Tanacetum coccineum]